ncbi:MAG TPA: TIGR03435 family protein [Bryobacteraceae bacterium]|jgi:uncharacterized protein (TIGR03435 family)|nr:TIGR03435 family protein [Bryobacteraceae bacterium]
MRCGPGFRDQHAGNRRRPAGVQSILAVFMFAVTLPAQPAFDVATLKPSPPPEGDLININIGRVANGRVTFANASLSDCLKFAYGIVSDDQLAGPDWIKSKSVRFDIVAQTAPDTPLEQIQTMLQALLAQRLKLALHHEQKEMTYLALIPGKKGPKMQLAKEGGAPFPNGISAAGHIASNQMTTARLATLLSRFERSIVIDETGLKGPFEIHLDWAVEPQGVQTTAEPPAGPSVFTAVEEQLGLRLESRKGPLDVLVVDHAEKIPADN